MMSKIYFKPGNMLYPLPVVMVSCGKDKPNIITVAWCGTICSNPPMLSISVKKERFSYHILEEEMEFVVNLTTKKLSKITDYCGVKSGKDVDKFKEMKLTPLKLEHVNCPGIKESPVNIECKVKEIKELGSHSLFIAEVVGVFVDRKYMDEMDRFCLEKCEPICYSHGKYYSLGEELGKFGFSVKK